MKFDKFFWIIFFFLHSIENLETFVKKFLDGSLEPHLKSEPLPEKNDGPVKVRF